MQPEDRGLVERMQAGDREAFGEVYEQYARRVYAFALRRLRDADEAEDVCQDVFVEVARSIRGFEGRSTLGTWILGITFHEVCNRRRRSSRRAVSLERHQDGVRPDEGSPVDRHVEAVRVLARCTDVLGSEIGEAHRVIFELALAGATDVAAIADQVGKSRQAVKISLFRTRRLLGERVVGLRELLARHA
ncbi:MAG: RNA polymerase sigma factor [Deltaproteobacteria bacterium]|nr:RNA polymerase sigma factor [Deltaproteobacteria bacterium]